MFRIPYEFAAKLSHSSIKESHDKAGLSELYYDCSVQVGLIEAKRIRSPIQCCGGIDVRS